MKVTHMECLEMLLPSFWLRCRIAYISCLLPSPINHTHSSLQIHIYFRQSKPHSHQQWYTYQDGGESLQWKFSIPAQFTQNQVHKAFHQWTIPWLCFRYIYIYVCVCVCVCLSLSLSAWKIMGRRRFPCRRRKIQFPTTRLSGFYEEFWLNSNLGFFGCCSKIKNEQEKLWRP